MGLAQPVQLASTKSDVRSRDFSIMLGYAAFALVMLIVIGMAAGQSGTSPIDLAAVTIFP
jgi:hypothetical protein